MKCKWSSASAITLYLFTNLADAQPTTIHEQIQQVYSFQPHLLTHQQIAQRSAVLDEFWNKAKAQASTTVPNLRRELGDFSNPPFFLYDGSMLLLSLSDSNADRQIALAAMAHCDLRDVQATDYFIQVHRLAGLNENTTDAALHVLDLPDFKVFIPQHSLTLGQDYVLVYLLLPTDEGFWINPALERLRREKDETAQKSLLLVLWYAQTEAADRGITAFADDRSKPAASQKYARELLNREKTVTVIQRAPGMLTTDASLRQKRRERMKSVSDEALIDLDDYTKTLMAKRR